MAEASIGKQIERIGTVFRRPEFRIVWYLVALIIIAFALGARFLPPLYFWIQGAAMFTAALAVFWGFYYVARAARETTVERNELRGIVGSLSDALIVYDENFKAFYFNSAAERLFRVSADLVLDHRFEPQDVEKPMWRLLAQVIFPTLAPLIVVRSKADEYPQVIDLSFSDPALELRVATSPIYDESGGLVGFMKIVRDRTREILLLKSKNEFITVASHQLRTPVTEIKWAFQTLADDESLNPSSRAIVENGARAAGELLKIIEDFLNIAKIEEGRFGYEFQPTDIVEFLGGLLAQAEPLVKQAGVKLYFDRPEEQLPKVWIDTAKLSLAVNNILENSIRYNVENGQVTVKVGLVPGQPFLEVSVKDTGIGMSEEDLKNLFRKFWRSDVAMKYQPSGSGLGLYIAKNVVQSHGGRIWVESELNRGTVFHFTLPTDQAFVPRREVPLEY